MHGRSLLLCYSMEIQQALDGMAYVFPIAEFHYNCTSPPFIHYFYGNGYKFYSECTVQHTNSIGWNYFILLISVGFFVSKNMIGSCWLPTMRNNLLFVSCSARVFGCHFVNIGKPTTLSNYTGSCCFENWKPPGLSP